MTTEQQQLFESTAAPVIAFAVTGTPQSQGSKVASSYVGKRIKVGGAVAIINPRVVLVEQSDMKTKKFKSQRLKRWRAKIEHAARLAMKGAPFLDQAVELHCEFVFQRPPSHWTKLGRLTKSARSKVPSKDLSKLVRAVEDALTKIVYRDDVLVIRYSNGTGKRFASKVDGRAGVLIEVKPCPPS